jgi:hypothetical protein
MELTTYEKKWQDKICPILWVKDKSIAIGFNGFGISIETDRVFNDIKEIKVKYKGKIGSPDFEIKI